MKGYHFFALILPLLTTIPLQSQEIIDQMASDACDCMNEKDLSDKSAEEIQMELSLCLMQKISSYQKQLQEQLKVNISDQKDMQDLGQKIGLKMVTICPETMMKMAQVQSATAPSAPEEAETYQLEGTVTGIEGDEFTFLVLKDESGRTQKFLWLRYFDGSDAFAGNPGSAVGKKVRLIYAPIECYSPKLNEYLQRNEIKALKVIE